MVKSFHRETLAFMKESEQDLAMLEKDPSHIEKMAKTAKNGNLKATSERS
jgi:hypothetical protein